MYMGWVSLVPVILNVVLRREKKDTKASFELSKWSFSCYSIYSNPTNGVYNAIYLLIFEKWIYIFFCFFYIVYFPWYIYVALNNLQETLQYGLCFTRFASFLSWLMVLWKLNMIRKNFSPKLFYTNRRNWDSKPENG